MASRSSTKSSKKTTIGRDVNIKDGDFVSGDKHVHYHLGASDEMEAGQKQALEIPRLLPYQVNRKLQEERLSDLYSKHIPQKPKPFVIVIHGDDKQAHEAFLERIREEFLPKLLKINTTDTSVKQIELPWPGHIPNLAALNNALTKTLGENVLDTGASIDEIQATVAAYNCPSIIATTLLTEDWMKFKNGILNTVLNFWNAWPALVPNQTLFIFVFIKHKLSDKSKMQEIILNMQKTKILKQLDECNFDVQSNIHGLILPELEDVPRSETENWARVEARNHCGGDVPSLISKITTLYGNQEGIPMDTLAVNLKMFLVAE